MFYIEKTNKKSLISKLKRKTHGSKSLLRNFADQRDETFLNRDLVLIKHNITQKLQSKKWQTFGHIENDCCKEPRCVRWAGNHLTAKYRKPRNQDPKCVNCGEADSTKYQECFLAEQL